MRIITLWEPWATLMARGDKRIETRSWSTRYRGPMAIHAAKGGLGDFEMSGLLEEPFFKEAMTTAIMNPGHILAVVNLVDCVEVSRLERLGRSLFTLKEKAFGNYAEGRFGWITGDLFRLDYPIIHKGGQGLRNASADVIQQIKAQGWQSI